jgi:hypothetical protein
MPYFLLQNEKSKGMKKGHCWGFTTGFTTGFEPQPDPPKTSVHTPSAKGGSDFFFISIYMNGKSFIACGRRFDSSLFTFSCIMLASTDGVRIHEPVTASTNKVLQMASDFRVQQLLPYCSY